MVQRVMVMALLAWALVTGCGREQPQVQHWEVTDTLAQDSSMHWAPFVWVNDSFGNRYIERASIDIPAHIDGLPFRFSFQFDLGSNATMIYESHASELARYHPTVNLNQPVIRFGSFRASTPHCYFYPDGGVSSAYTDERGKGIIRIGSIGADFFRNKVLVIDYPNQRFSICTGRPAQFAAVPMSPMELDSFGRVVLPMQLGTQQLRVLFDNGSSIFPLITTPEKIGRFSKEADTDTLSVPAWGKLHTIGGRLMRDSFLLAGQSFGGVQVYTDYTSNSEETGVDAITGNALFWDRVVIIDFDKKRFGITDSLSLTN